MAIFYSGSRWIRKIIVHGRCLEYSFRQVSYEFKASSTGGCDFTVQFKFLYLYTTSNDSNVSRSQGQSFYANKHYMKISYREQMQAKNLPVVPQNPKKSNLPWHSIVHTETARWDSPRIIFLSSA